MKALEPNEEPAHTLGIDPLADLFFSLVAIAVLALIMLLPLLRSVAPGETEFPPEVRAALSGAVTVHGAPAEVIVALASGATYGRDPARTVALDAIPDDPGLADWLGTLRREGTPLALIVAADGLEADFELEALIATKGPQTIAVVRRAGP
jgi:hypothetical protein